MKQEKRIDDRTALALARLILVCRDFETVEKLQKVLRDNGYASDLASISYQLNGGLENDNG